MKFLIDECISRSVYNFFKSHFDTKYVQDTMPSASDNEILEAALKENRIVITGDKDFGDMIFRDKKQHVGIILLRLKIRNPINQITVLKKVIDECSSEIIGNFTIATDDSIKVIKLVFH